MRIGILDEQNRLINVIVADEVTAEALHPGQWVNLTNLAWQQGQVWNGEAFEDPEE